MTEPVARTEEPVERAEPAAAEAPAAEPSPVAAPIADPPANGVLPLPVPEALPVAEPHAEREECTPVEEPLAEREEYSSESTPHTPHEVLPSLEPEEPTVKVLISPAASRRLAESLIIFVCAILLLRATAVEPFGVPTGSMAPTLIGNHKVASCPRCNYVIRVGEPSRPHGASPKVTCPNCGKHDIDISRAADIAGDRLLVDKNVYSLRRPRRWEPAVFRCPSDMSKPYVKRVIGLPGESVFVVDGDIHINGKLARKTLAESRETRVPVFDMNLPPQPEGWVKRWLLESNLPPPENGDAPPEPVFVLADRELRLEGTRAARTPVWVAYRHHGFDEMSGEEREEVIRDGFVYNGPSGEDKTLPVHDFFIEFEVEVTAGTGALLCRLLDGKDRLVATCPVGGSTDDADLRHEGFGVVRTGARKPLQHGKKYRIEMAFVDRRVSFAIDGDEPFAAYDLDLAETRADVTSPLAVGVQGANLIIRDVRLYRDIYYRSSGKNAVEEPFVLRSDEYFMMGDNSANSDDSRSWPIPGVPERNFLGKPFLLHQPSRLSRTTFNGRERVFQSIDWSRIRFLR